MNTETANENFSKAVPAGTIVGATTEGAILGYVISRLRARHKPPMRQQELASAIDGMSASAWSRVEKGETELTALQLVKVAKVLDTDVNSILEEANHLIEKLRDTNFRVEAMTLKELESDSRKRKLDGVSAAAIAAGAAAISSVAPVVIPVIGIAALAGVISQLFNED